MNTATLSHRAASRGSYGFRTVAAMEWRKLRTVRSTWYLVAVFGAGLIGLAVLAAGQENYAQMSAAGRASFDPTYEAFLGLVPGQLLLGVLGLLAITTEFSSGMIRATFAAAPGRPLVLAAKAAVLGAVTLVAGEISAFAAFYAGQAMLRAPAPHAALGQPGVLRAVAMAGAYPALIALISLGIGAIIRHTAGAICGMVGVLFVLPLLSLTRRLAPGHGAEVPARHDEEFADRGQAGRAPAVAGADFRLAVRVRDGRARGRGLGAGPPGCLNLPVTSTVSGHNPPRGGRPRLGAMTESFASVVRGRWRPGAGFLFRLGRGTLVESLYLLTAPVTAAAGLLLALGSLCVAAASLLVPGGSRGVAGALALARWSADLERWRIARVGSPAGGAGRGPAAETEGRQPPRPTRGCGSTWRTRWWCSPSSWSPRW